MRHDAKPSGELSARTYSRRVDVDADEVERAEMVFSSSGVNFGASAPAAAR